jgi:hypothetical protein
VSALYTRFGNSFYVAELGRGGGLDRSAKPAEDNRKFGQYTMRAVFADTAVIANNRTDFVVHVDPPLTYNSDTEAFAEFPVRFSSLSRYSQAFNKAADAGVVIPLYHNSSWTVDRFVIDPALNRTPQIGAGGATNVTVTTVGAPTYSVTVKFNDPAGVAGAPMEPGITGRTIKVGRLIMKKALPLGTDDLFSAVQLGPWLGPVFNQALVTYDAAGSQLAPLAWQATQMNPDGYIQTADQEASTVQYAYKTGMVGIEQDLNLRARGIFALLESAGEADINRAVKPVFGLYNTIMAGDRRLMSAQYRDYVGQDTEGNAKGEMMVPKAETIRKRLNSGKRTFGGGAKYRSGAPLEDAYFIDSPERDMIGTSASARGASLAAMIFGFISDKAQRLRIHKLFLTVLGRVEFGAKRRRTGHK